MNEEKRCETCAHWGDMGRMSGWLPERNGRRPCAAMWDAGGTGASAPDAVPEVVSFDEGALYTLPMFGCVLHSPKGGAE